MERLKELEWPGNVRELRNLIERVMILEEAELIELSHLPPSLLRADGGDAAGEPPSVSLPPGGLALEEVERELIRQALELASGNQSRAASLLGIGRDALRYKMKKHGYLQADSQP